MKHVFKIFNGSFSCYGHALFSCYFSYLVDMLTNDTYGANIMAIIISLEDSQEVNSGLAALFAKLGLIAPEMTTTTSLPLKSTSAHLTAQLDNNMEVISASKAEGSQVGRKKVFSKKELERQTKERDEKLYESKERETRCLGKFRDNLLLTPKSGKV